MGRKYDIVTQTDMQELLQVAHNGALQKALPRLQTLNQSHYWTSWGADCKVDQFHHKGFEDLHAGYAPRLNCHRRNAPTLLHLFDWIFLHSQDNDTCIDYIHLTQIRDFFCCTCSCATYVSTTSFWAASMDLSWLWVRSSRLWSLTTGEISCGFEKSTLYVTWTAVSSAQYL